MLLAVGQLAAAGAAPGVSGTLTATHKLSSGAARSFTIIAGAAQKDSPEFLNCAGLVSEKLRAMGWTELPDELASVGIVLQYAVSEGRPIKVTTQSRETLRLPAVIKNDSNGGMSGNSATTIGNTGVEPGVMDVDKSSTEKQMIYDSSIRMTMFELQQYRRSGEVDQLYDGQFQSTGPMGKLPTLLPILVKGLLSDFPGTSGASRKVQLPSR